ncbi:MAG TPA: hypothetical protein VF176_05125 [Solirubrobacterales bacterium]
MRKNLIRILTLAAVVAVAVAGVAVASKPTVVRAGNLILTFNGDVVPKKLPKNTYAPIKLQASGKLATADGTHPPAIKQVILDFDKNGVINAKGLPVCKSGQLQARDTESAKKACPTAIIGKGDTEVEVQFEDSSPFTAKGPLVLFNGGVKGGVTTMFVHAYVSVPTPTAIVTTVKVKKINKGKFGYEAVASVPTIAGGAGSAVSFSLTVDRKFTYKGKKQSLLTAKCPTKHLYAHGVAAFSDGTRVAGDVVRACIQAG